VGLHSYDHHRGDTVRVRLVAPLVPVQVGPIVSESQRLDQTAGSGEWAWEVVANEPGDYELSITTSVLDSGGQVVVLENRRSTINLSVGGTAGYYSATIWSGFVTFFMGVGGIATALQH
jgi:hypothetical protein